MSTPAAWHPDPTNRHQLRYWDGSRWTDHVSDAGVSSTDPVGEAPPATDWAGQPTGPGPAAGPGPGAPASAQFGGYGAYGGDPTQTDYLVPLVGGGQVYTYSQLQQMAAAKALRPDMTVVRTSDQLQISAKHVPGIFSDKEWTTALILSVLVGSLGIDRFYLGHTGLGVLKLLTCGGLGIWAIIDVVLIAMRSMTDAQGRQLS